MNKKAYGFFKDELGGKVMKKFVALRAKAYAYLTHDEGEEKKSKRAKRCVIKRELMFKNYKDCLFNGEVVLKSQRRFKSDHYKVYTEEVNKIVSSIDDDKRLQTCDGIETYPYGANAFKVCESEMMAVRGLFVENYTDFSFYDELILRPQDKRLSKI